MPTRTHVWMLNMGGPDRPEAIQPFLQRLLGDPNVVPLPFRWLQALFAWVVSRLRTPKVLPAYEKMGGASPQLKMVEDQARHLGRVLGGRYHCRPVLRYWGPTAAQAAESIDRGDQVVLLSLYPHACRATTRTSLEDARRALAGKDVQVAEVESYPRHEGYVEAVAETLREGIHRLPRGAAYQVVFSAHGVPEKWVEKDGDPYAKEVRATVRAVVQHVGLTQPHHLSFQSRLGPTKWLQPATIDKVAELGAAGVKAVVVVPVAFTSEHIETLIELDEELAHTARAAGVEHFVRAPTVGTRPTFVRALADLVRQAERDAGWAVPEDEVREAVQAQSEREPLPARPSPLKRPPTEERKPPVMRSRLKDLAKEAAEEEEAPTVLINAVDLDGLMTDEH